MIIDDSPAIRYMLQTILGKRFEVTSVADAVSAMHHLRESNLPDLIIVDPEISGGGDWELVGHLTTSPIFSHIPVIVISDKSEEETRTNAVLFGAMDFFLKPFNPISLLESIDNVLVCDAMGKVY